MTDDEIEMFYNSVESIDNLLEQLTQLEDVYLSDKVSLKNVKDKVQITIDSNPYLVDQNYLTAILTEFRQQQGQDHVNESSSDRFDKSSDLENIGNNSYYAHNELLTNMSWARQASGGEGFYRRKINEMVKLLKAGKTLVTDKKTYKSISEFIVDFKVPE
ncbi:MAG: hypothetical protein AAGI07_11560 [Bacteroidota bacterium]